MPKLLNQFKKKYGQPIETIILNKSDHITFRFPKDRWVHIDETGELSWDGKKNQYNIINSIKENKEVQNGKTYLESLG